MFFLTNFLLLGSAMMGLVNVNEPEIKVAPRINIIFDLGGVVIETNKWQATKLIGLGNIISYRKSPRVPFFAFLDSLVPRSKNCPSACDEDGNLLPQLMCDWMTGAKTGKQIAQMVRIGLMQTPLMRRSERAIFHRMNRFMFDDIDLYLSTKRISKQAQSFIQQCKQSGYGLYILSNWDKESINVYKQQQPEFFNLFDGIVISGEEGLIKPDPLFFKKLLDRYNLDPATTVFIDDQKENIESAQTLGLFGIHCTSKGAFSKSPDFKKINSEFNAWKESLEPVINPA